MGEVKCYAIAVSKEELFMNDTVMDEIKDMDGFVGVNPGYGDHAFLLFRSKKDRNGCLLKIKHILHTANKVMPAAYIDERYLNGTVEPYKDPEMEEMINKIKEDGKKELRAALAEDITKVEEYKSEIQSLKRRLDYADATIEQKDKLIDSLRIKYKVDMESRDKRIREITKECLDLEHRMEEMEKRMRGEN